MVSTKTAKRVGNPQWKKGMPSPNPKGRPPGISDKRAKLAQRMLDDANGIVDAMIGKALDGDTGAAGLILGRILPALRSQTEKVTFQFDATAPTILQVEQVLRAVSEGKVAPDVGKQIIEAIGALSAVRAVDDLEERIITLEAKQI